MAEDIKADYIKKNEVDYPDVAIKMKNGNFYWLTEEEKKLKKKKEEEEAENEDEEANEKEEKSSEEEKKEILEEDEEEGVKLVLQDMNLDIKKGSFVVILGE